jgi:hypothetical protein
MVDPPASEREPPRSAVNPQCGIKRMGHQRSPTAMEHLAHWQAASTKPWTHPRGFPEIIFTPRARGLPTHSPSLKPRVLQEPGRRSNWRPSFHRGDRAGLAAEPERRDTGGVWALNDHPLKVCERRGPRGSGNWRRTSRQARGRRRGRGRGRGPRSAASGVRH